MKTIKSKALDDFETIQIIGGFIVLIMAGFVIQWWLMPGVILFGIALILLCMVIIEVNASEKRS